MKSHLHILDYPEIMLFSCTKNNKNSDLTLALSQFDKINLIDPFDIYLEEDSIYSINIYGDEKNITFVKVNIDSNTLNIENERKLYENHLL